jgi:hypothetical protein
MLTTGEQLLLIEMFCKKKIGFSDQGIYKSSKRFYEAISKLKESKFVESRPTKKNGEKIYFLIFPNGWILGNLLIDSPGADIKYKKSSSKFLVIP